MEFKHEL